MQRACINNLVAQKIKQFYTIAKFSKKISKILIKNFVHLGLEKKELKNCKLV